MEVRELRVGNWYNWYADGEYYQFQVEPKDFKDEKYLNFEPIPLTEEWLERFGFRKTFDSPFEDFEWSDNNLQLSENFDCYLGKFTQPIQYVHQLQNLSFALTGEELKLKTDK